jgi:hypothetical protein
VCTQHLDEVLATRGREWLVVPDDGLLSDDVLCSTPECLATEQSIVNPCFIYVWRRGQEPEQRFAQYCEGHSLDVINAYALVAEESRPTP